MPTSTSKAATRHGRRRRAVRADVTGYPQRRPGQVPRKVFGWNGRLRHCVGVVLVVVHLTAGRDPRWGWTAVMVLLTAGTLGATMFLPWWSRGRNGLYGDNDPAGFYPAEDHFRMRTVKTNGGPADLTWILLIIALLVT